MKAAARPSFTASSVEKLATLLISKTSPTEAKALLGKLFVPKAPLRRDQFVLKVSWEMLLAIWATSFEEFTTEALGIPAAAAAVLFEATDSSALKAVARSSPEEAWLTDEFVAAG